MRNVFILFFCFSTFIAFSQIKGNKNIITQSFPFKGIKTIDADLYADITIDCSAPAGITITTDANLMGLISKTTNGNKLKLVQKEWIQPSQDVIIKIGAPDLVQVNQSVHETISVINIDREEFNVMAILGDIKLEGQVQSLNASAESGDIDASDLIVKKVNVNIWDDGRLVLNKIESISGILKEDGKVTYNGGNPEISVKTKGDSKVIDKTITPSIKNPRAQWITLKIKNNSSNRINAYVKGPKPDGKSFSYGFPMRPGQVKEERWTVGSKVYKSHTLGTKKVLVEITAEDEGQIVTLYN